MQILESLARTYIPKVGAALYEKWLAGGRKASVFSREAREAMIKGFSKELRLAGKEYETVWGGVKDATPVNSKFVPDKTATLNTPKTIPTKTVNGEPTPDITQSIPTKGQQPNLGDDVRPSGKEGNPGVKVENNNNPNGGETPRAAGGKVPGGVDEFHRKISKTTEESITVKLDTYLLEPTHPIGGSKAKLFKEALGFSKDNSAVLANQIFLILKELSKQRQMFMA